MDIGSSGNIWTLISKSIWEDDDLNSHVCTQGRANRGLRKNIQEFLDQAKMWFSCEADGILAGGGSSTEKSPKRCGKEILR